MQAVAMNDVNATTYEYARTQDAVRVKNTGCVIAPEEFWEKFLDWQLELETTKRLANLDERLYSMEEVMEESGLTMKDLAGWEDVELE